VFVASGCDVGGGSWAASLGSTFSARCPVEAMGVRMGCLERDVEECFGKEVLRASEKSE